MKLTYREYFGIAAIIFVIAVVGVILQRPGLTTGSTVVGNDYMATSTRNSAGTALTNLTLLKTVGGTLARVTITGANTGIVRFYNATTSDVNKRTGNPATSTLLMVEIPASAASDTYDFDAEFNTGILYELVSGLAPTSTISFR
jgi:hypothetical protein